MHSGEEWFSLNWQQYLALTALLATYLVLVFANKLPRMSAFKDFVDTINTAGGHLLILSLFTWWAIKISMQYFYHILGMPGDTVSKQQAIVTAGTTFVTGMLAGNFIGALLKTMTGGKANGNGGGPDTLTATLTPENGASPRASSPEAKP